jgi:hypothetical protein
MSIRSFAALLCGAALTLTLTACEKTIDPKIVYSSVIGNYYYNHPDCLWPVSQQFPSQAETSDHSQTMPFDALVDQGLLVRTTAEKKKFIVASKQVNNYDLSDKGRGVWTADETKPGFGNFCYGRRKVTSIDSSTPTTGKPGDTTQITYHYNLIGVPDWAHAAEIQNTYPQVQANLAGPQSSTATLTNTDAGWQVTSVPTPPNQPVTGADGKTVP